MEILSTKGLSKNYNEFAALNGVSINVSKGEIYGLIGKNGAGKTTFFKLVMGLSSITSGEVSIEGGLRSVGFMISASFFPDLSARKNLEFYRRTKGIKDKSETDRVLKMVDLYGVNKPFKDFSMGMKQRLGIANALLGKPAIIILDEPINGLDPQGIADIRNMIIDINKQEGTTFIISSHILSELDLVATKFGFIDKGVLIKEATHEELHKEMERNNNLLEVLDVDAATKALKENNVEYKVLSQEDTLEEYFLKLVGGGHDA
ncbi:ABC transporter ATP-binding protein [Treponema sp. R6D11]